MKRLMFLLLTGLLAICTAFMLGCEEDAAITDDGGNHTILTPEDSSMVEDMLTEDMLSTPLDALGVSWELVDHIPGAQGAKFSGTSLALGTDEEEMIITDAGYEGYSDGWHIFHFAAVAVDQYSYGGVDYYDTVFIGGWDSIQVIADGVPIQYPNDQTVVEGLNERAHVNWEDNDDEHTGSLNHIIEADMSYVEGDTILTLNGSTDDQIYSGENREWGVCDITMTLDQTITNLVFNVNVEGDCPESGTISSISSIDAFCTGLDANAGDTLDVNSSWTVTATINEGEGTVTVTFTSGAISWTVTEPCDEGGAQATSGWNK
ncbi:MAG: hypothetical protein OEV49_15650 [candidate division Zixibacteria bacterium]|nr:hypothetical protein [candidate division Zixibacteria bacterium]MDH3937858.1 hypothetical protein [candidate division Zixibacteria bacterium]MDH4033422.1 hypothetical protein [candidate division Zixibacteria bacterium]